MVPKHVLWFNSSGSSQHYKFVEYICHVIASEEVIIKYTVQRAEVVLVTLPEIYKSLRSVVEEDAVSVRRPLECSFRVCAVFDQKRRRLVQRGVGIQRPLHLPLRCEIGCVVSKVIEVKEGHGGTNFLSASGILAIEVLLWYTMFIEGSTGFLSKAIVPGMRRRHLKVRNRFRAISAVNVDEVVVFRIRVDELPRTVHGQGVLI